MPDRFYVGQRDYVDALNSMDADFAAKTAAVDADAAEVRAIKNTFASLLAGAGVVRFYDTNADMQAGVSSTDIPNDSIVRVFQDELNSNYFTWYRVNKGETTDPTLTLIFTDATYSVLTIDLKRAEA